MARLKWAPFTFNIFDAFYYQIVYFDENISFIVKIVNNDKGKVEAIWAWSPNITLYISVIFILLFTLLKQNISRAIYYTGLICNFFDCPIEIEHWQSFSCSVVSLLLWFQRTHPNLTSLKSDITFCCLELKTMLSQPILYVYFIISTQKDSSYGAQYFKI